MKYGFIASAASILTLALSPSAMALIVTNMDSVPHTVTYDAAGSHFEQTAQPNDTVTFTGLSNGTLSLKTPYPKPNNGNLHADGMLSGIVGAERDQEIPVSDENNEYVIWSGGELLLQHASRNLQHH